MARALAALVLLVVAPVAQAVGGVGLQMQASVTGEIGELGPQTIKVGHVACAIPAKLSVSAGRFVIGDPVRIICAGGKLKSVKYAPENPPNQTSKYSSTTTPTLPNATRPDCAPSCPGSTMYSISTIFFGGGPTGDTSSATGPISDLSDGSVTVGDLTCTLYATEDTVVNRVAIVGDDVTLTCTGGVFIGMKTVGAVSR